MKTWPLELTATLEASPRNRLGGNCPNSTDVNGISGASVCFGLVMTSLCARSGAVLKSRRARVVTVFLMVISVPPKAAVIAAYAELFQIAGRSSIGRGPGQP